MKYFSLGVIHRAINNLKPHHPVFATTFFVMKEAHIPVGRKMRFRLDGENDTFLKKHYRVHPKSLYFFRVMRQNNPGKDWNAPKYASAGLQRVNTGLSPAVFLHDRNENTWGWSPGYVRALAKKLPRGMRVPLFYVAVWLYRDKAWPDETTQQGVVAKIIADYGLTEEELACLFACETDSDLSDEECFQQVPAKWHQILELYSSPEDVSPEPGGILRFLEIENVGPAVALRFEPAPRLNVVTGDNGLGKTFLLDLCWWALTQDWAERPAWCEKPSSASIKFAVSPETEVRPVRARLNTSSLDWVVPKQLPAVSGLVIYARVDGSFAIWDPANTVLAGTSPGKRWPGLKFTQKQVWDGEGDQIEGLIRDWVRWQERSDKYPAFDTFKTVLKRVSPPELGPLEIDEPTRLPGEIRPIPTLKHPYGNVPILFESAGIRRILTLVYLIVWTWEEHKVQARQAHKREERQMVVLVDEVEAHLHPKWQRVILPALLDIGKHLSEELSMQLIAATHSPLVLASSEPVFDPEQDKLFLLQMSSSGKVDFREVPFETRGTPDSWLSSNVFQLKHPGSPERERAIAAALALQEVESTTREQVQEVTDKLRDALAPEDPFWVRWVFFAERHGVDV